MVIALPRLQKAQKAFILQGSGANGKSVLLSVLTALVGKENVSNLPISSLGSHFKVVDLLNKNVNIVSEGNFKANLFSSEDGDTFLYSQNVRLSLL